jgi:DNA-binding IclR family transcriptional regulator
MTDSSPQPEQSPGVPALDRALTVLECIAQSRKGFSVSELSRRLTLPKSSVHLILRTFERRGYLQKQPTGGRYRFGLKLMSLGHLALDGVELRDEARPILQRLVLATGLTAHLGILERGEIVIIERVDAATAVRVVSFIGRRMKVHSTAVGKALLAFLPPDSQEMQLVQAPLEPQNERTIASPLELRRDLDQVREQGYSVNDEEDELGVRAVGAPILSADGVAIAAISVVGTTGQLTLDRVTATGRAVREAALEISIHMQKLHVLA